MGDPIIEEIELEKFTSFNSFIKKSRNMTPRILSIQLKELGSAGLIKKEAQAASRKTTRYKLTAKGQEMHKIITEIKKWNIRWNKAPASCISTACTECDSFRI